MNEITHGITGARVCDLTGARRLTGRRSGWFGASLGVIAIAIAMPAWAQAAGPATGSGTAATRKAPPKSEKSDQTDGGQIVVTGIRGSLQSARARKRNSDQIIDSISAQDIGALPDRSVAETLQRIPGVSLTRTASELTTGRPTDPGRIAPEGGGVTIRGLTGVASTSNGRDIFSAGTRALAWAEVSSDLIAGIDVYKNPSAEMIEGALSGIIDLRSRKPFDQNGQLISFSADASYGDLWKKGFFSGNALYSNRWATKGGAEFGFLLGLSLNNKGTRTNTIQDGTPAGQILQSAVGSRPAGTTVYVPSGVGLSSIDWSQRREMGDGVLQFRPNPDMTFTAEAVIAKAHPHEFEHAAFTDPPSVNSTAVFDSNNALIGETLPAENLYLDSRHGDYHYLTRDYSLNWNYSPSGSPWKLSADVQRITSKADVLSFTVFDNFATTNSAFFNPNRPTLAFNFGSDPFITTTPVAGHPYSDKGSYVWAAAMDHIEHNTTGEWASRADAEYDFDNAFLKSLHVGFRWADKDYAGNQTTYNWSLLSAEFWGGGTPVYLTQDASPGLSQQTGYFTFPSFMHGAQASPLAGWFPSASLLDNTQNAYNYLHATETAGWGWSPLTFQNNQSNVADQKEITKAGYVMLRFGEDSGVLGRFEGNAGVRIVSTIAEGNGYASLVSAPKASLASCLTANAANPSSCDALALALKFLGAGADPTKQPKSTPIGPFKSHYTDVLPSLDLNFHLTDQLQVRLAAAKAMLRPDFRQTSPTSGYSLNLDNTGAVQPNVYPFGGNLGNPYLLPEISWQGDTSVEYYWGRSNTLALDLFYKDIANQIETKSEAVNLTANGVTLPFIALTFDNAKKHAKIYGLEADYTQFFDFLNGPLSGLGFQGNFTYIHATGGINSAYAATAGGAKGVSSAPLPYEQLSKYAYNLALIYSRSGIDARLAYNWRSKYLLTIISANNFSPTWAEDYGQLDGSVFVNLTKNIKVGVQGTNILGAKTYLDHSLLMSGGQQVVVPLKEVRSQVTDKDRVIDVALRVKI